MVRLEWLEDQSYGSLSISIRYLHLIHVKSKGLRFYFYGIYLVFGLPLVQRL